MNVNLDVDATRLLRRLRNPEKRVAFAVVNAINATTKTAQRAVQLKVGDEFTIRRPSFVLKQAAIVKPFASVGQGRAYAEIAVGRRSRLLLSTLAEGGTRTPFTKGAKSVAVPVGARPSKEAQIPEELTFRRLAFKRPKATTAQARRNRRSGSSLKIREGAQNTYLIPGEGVFQRTPGGGSRVLYVFARPFPLRRQFHFVETVHESARLTFGPNLHREIRETLERTR